MISIIEYGMGNLGSIVNMLKKIGVATERISDAEKIMDAKKIILPGVGSFDNAIKKINDLGIKEVIKERANSGTPILGICLGMQLLGTSSQEGTLEGLDLIPGTIKKFPNNIQLPIPHMGWNKVRFNNYKVNKILKINKFYFVHSYYYQPDDNRYIAGTTDYGLEFASFINKSNIFGVQFHPEKSHRYGMEFLRYFSNL